MALSDGIFGPLTDAAVRNYQRAHGLVVEARAIIKPTGALTA